MLYGSYLKSLARLINVFIFIVLLLTYSHPISADSFTVTNASLETEVAQKINLLRQTFGFQCLHYNNTLVTVARNHLVDMDERGYFGHNTPEGATPEDRARAAGYLGWAAESLIAGRPTPTEAMSGWRASRLHYRGFFFTYSHEMGVGYYLGGNTYSHYYGFVQGRLDNDSPGPLTCNAIDLPTVTHVPNNLAVTSAFNPVITWSHQAASSGGRVPATNYSIEIIEGTDIFYGSVIVSANSNAYQANEVCNAGICSVTLNTSLEAGEYTLFIRAYSPDGDYVWTGDEQVFGDQAEALVFNVDGTPDVTDEPQPPPNEPISRIAPSANQVISTGGDYVSKFQWSPIDGAEWYHVFVSTPDFSQVFFDKWYMAADVCTEMVCTTTHDVWLVGNGEFAWWMTYWSESIGANYSNLYTESRFTLSLPNPGAVSGGNYSAETVLWDAEANSLWYQVWVGPADYSDTSYLQWVNGADACSGGTCSVNVGSLSTGDYELWIQAWNPAGTTDWQKLTEFTVGS